MNAFSFCVLCAFLWLKKSLWLILGEGVVGIAVQPTLTNFRGRDHWMTTRTGMLRRMPVWRTVATSSCAALLTRAQVNPACSDLHALFANSLLRLFDVGDRIDMNAYLCCHAASIQFADDSPLGDPYVCRDTLAPDLKVDRVLMLVLQFCQHLAEPGSDRRRMIVYQS